jgi:GNAT superfamily N-acetyltransferase
MEARELLHLDESRYRRLRLEAAKETSWQRTRELQKELALFEQGGDGVIAAYDAQGTRLWGAFHETHLAGAVGLSLVPHHADMQQLWLWGLYVTPRFRGTPASRCLMSAVQDWGEQHFPGGAIVGAYHRDNRHAWQWVERFGFRPSPWQAEAEHAGLISAEDVVVECSSRKLGYVPNHAQDGRRC